GRAAPGRHGRAAGRRARGRDREPVYRAAVAARRVGFCAPSTVTTHSACPRRHGLVRPWRPAALDGGGTSGVAHSIRLRTPGGGLHLDPKRSTLIRTRHEDTTARPSSEERRGGKR